MISACCPSFFGWGLEDRQIPTSGLYCRLNVAPGAATPLQVRSWPVLTPHPGRLLYGLYVTYCVVKRLTLGCARDFPKFQGRIFQSCKGGFSKVLNEDLPKLSISPTSPEFQQLQARRHMML